jgi:hypothetical protein
VDADPTPAREALDSRRAAVAIDRRDFARRRPGDHGDVDGDATRAGHPTDESGAGLRLASSGRGALPRVRLGALDDS